MPSPFPGMDPYLEAYGPWPDFHQSFITYMRDALQPSLGPRYHARIGERVYVTLPAERPMYPDLSVAEVKASAPPREATAGLQTLDAPVVITVPGGEIREGFIEIVDAETGQRVVTVLELLSPANKVPGSRGRDLYRVKQHEVLESTASLVEIDLLHEGEQTVAPPPQELAALGEFDYLVSIRRAHTWWEYHVHPIGLRSRLPRIAVPLERDDPVVPLDLQALFDRCYDNAAYANVLDYGRPVPEFVVRDDRRWAEQLLADKGVR